MSWKSTLKAFIVNEAANFGLIFALSSPVLVGGAVAAVETTTLIRSRVQLQNALDAAALATGKHLAETTDAGELEAYARDFFKANLHPGLDQNRVTLQFSLIDNPDAAKRIRLEADYDYPRVMGSLFGADDITLDIGSEVTAGNKTIEVAIVIDNSGSMNSYTGGTTDTRLEKAQEAAKALATQLFSLTAISNKPDPVQISVVPFASSVNIGPANRGAGFMDMNGWSSIHHENFDWEATAKRGDDWPLLQPLSGGWRGLVDGANTAPPSGGGAVQTDWLTRWSLFDAIDEDWAGCVEMRPWPHHAQDTAPSSLNPDTLFVPMFAPDEAERLTSNEDRDYINDYLDEYRRAYSHSLTYNYYGRHYLEYFIPGEGYNYNNFTRQHWRQGWTMKYNMDARLSRLGNSISRDMGRYGPNMMCTTTPLTELTNNPVVVENAIDAMVGAGFTNIQAGIAWAWRTLSAGEPFTRGRGYNEIENDKYIIVLTDGNNTYPNQSTRNQSQYTSWGYEKDGRIFDGTSGTSSLTVAMDEHTATTCANLKAIQDADNESAYKIFTIAYDVPDGSSVKALLYGCASTRPDGGKYYYDVSGNALSAAMQAIGNEISDLRISQ